MFTAWEAACLGAWEGLTAAAAAAAAAVGQAAAAVVDPVEALATLSGGVVGPLVSTFSLLAIATSYIGERARGGTAGRADQRWDVGKGTALRWGSGTAPAAQEPRRHVDQWWPRHA